MAVNSELEEEVLRAGGQVEWVTSLGYGVSFSKRTIDRSFIQSIPNAIQRVVWLSFAGSDVSEDVWEEFLAAEKLEAFDLSDTNVTVENLRVLSTLPKLAEVRIGRLAISEHELAELSSKYPQIHFRLS